MNRKDMDIVAGYIDATVELAVRKAVEADRLTRGAATETASAFTSAWKDALDSLAKEIHDAETKDSASVTVEDLAPMVAAEVEKAVAALPAPEPGKDADPATITAMVAEAMATIPAPKDGTSVTVDDVAPLVAAEVAKAVAAIPPAQPGKDADPALVELMVRRAVSEMPAPAPGRDGVATRDELHTLIAEAVAKAVPDAVQKAVTAAVDALPRMEYREVWRDGETYKSGNVVTFGGNAWVCMVDGTTDKPGVGDSGDWRLMVRKGRDGRDKRE